MTRLTLFALLLSLPACFSRVQREFVSHSQSVTTICWPEAERDATPFALGTITIENTGFTSIVVKRIKSTVFSVPQLETGSIRLERDESVTLDVVATQYFKDDSSLLVPVAVSDERHESSNDTDFEFAYRNECPPGSDPDPDPEPGPDADIEVHDAGMERANIPLWMPPGFADFPGATVLIPGGGAGGGVVLLYDPPTGDLVSGTPIQSGFGWPEQFEAVAVSDPQVPADQQFRVATNHFSFARFGGSWGLVMDRGARWSDANVTERDANGHVTKHVTTYPGFNWVRQECPGFQSPLLVSNVPDPGLRMVSSALDQATDDLYSIGNNAADDDTTSLYWQPAAGGPLMLIGQTGRGGVKVRIVRDVLAIGHETSETISVYHRDGGAGAGGAFQFRRDLPAGRVRNLELIDCDGSITIFWADGTRLRWHAMDAQGDPIADATRAPPEGMKEAHYAASAGPGGMIVTGVDETGGVWFYAPDFAAQFDLDEVFDWRT